MNKNIELVFSFFERHFKKIVTSIVIIATVVSIFKPIIDITKDNEVKLFGYFKIYSNTSNPYENLKTVLIGNGYQGRNGQKNNQTAVQNNDSIQYTLNDSDHIGNLIAQNSFFITILFSIMGFAITIFGYFNWKNWGRVDGFEKQLEEELRVLRQKLDSKAENLQNKVEVGLSNFEKKLEMHGRYLENDLKQKELFDKIRKELLEDPDLEGAEDKQILESLSKRFCEDKKEEALKYFFAGKHIQPEIQGGKKLKGKELYSPTEIDQLRFALDYFNIADQKFPFNDSREIRRCIYVYKANVYKELGNHYFYKNPEITKEYYFESLKLYQRAIECDPYNIQAYNNKGNVLIKTYDLIKVNKTIRDWLSEVVSNSPYKILELNQKQDNLLEVILDNALICFEEVLNKNKGEDKDDLRSYSYNFAIANLKKVEQNIREEAKNVSEDNIKQRFKTITASENGYFSNFLECIRQAIDLLILPSQKKVFIKNLKEDDDLSILLEIKDKEDINPYFKELLEGYLK